MLADSRRRLRDDRVMALPGKSWIRENLDAAFGATVANYAFCRFVGFQKSICPVARAIAARDGVSSVRSYGVYIGGEI